jgi:hypothetical protein
MERTASLPRGRRIAEPFLPWPNNDHPLAALGSDDGQTFLGTLNRLIAGNETVAKPLNFKRGESIAYAQLLPTCLHDPLHHLSDGNAFTP